MDNDTATGHDSVQLLPGYTDNREHAWYANCECQTYFCNTTRVAAIMAWTAHAIMAVK